MAEVSSQFVVENRTPQGSVLSPTLISLMINYIFVNIPSGMGGSPFANDVRLLECVCCRAVCHDDDIRVG